MFDRCIYFNGNALVRTLNRIWEEAFQEFGLSPAHAYLLRYVLANPGCTQRAIARARELSDSTVTRFIDVLVHKRLIVRQGTSQDKREILVYPTKQGQALQDRLEATGKMLYQRMRKILGATGFDGLVAGMRSARENISAID